MTTISPSENPNGLNHLKQKWNSCENEDSLTYRGIGERYLVNNDIFLGYG